MEEYKSLPSGFFASEMPDINVRENQELNKNN